MENEMSQIWSKIKDPAVCRPGSVAGDFLSFGRNMVSQGLTSPKNKFESDFHIDFSKEVR
jgi:hypothetical protein